ncbi:glyoxalase [Pseudorhodobacter sp. E13]|uniref:VOC family protein n=1 Tax=Pseudorhodobacter sp. E13 TaxID=2487931 RepID=UPI000F8EDFE7|nr:VOC family protein [Pseudorhodobacter sp. E13]RUS60971.1 glyoxalase [Pseudorhodobacter sp. E13]
MDYNTVPAASFGHSLSGLTVNLLVRDVAAEVAFLTGVFGMQAFRQSADFAIVTYQGQPIQVHSDGSFAAHPLHGLLPEAGPRGAGIELRLHETDPDRACAQAEALGGVVLQPTTDKAGHGLREAVILSPHGYAFVPSVRI